MNEIELVQKFKQGDGNAFEEIFRSYITALNNYASFYTGSSQIAEDMVHDVFFKIWEKRKTIEIHTSIKSYLFRAVHNQCVQYLKHQKVTSEYAKKHEARLEEALQINKLYFETGLTRLFEKEIKDLVDKAIPKLPAKTREIFLLSRNKHLKHAEIAVMFNLTEKAVEYHVCRAITLLRKELKDYLPVVMLGIYGLIGNIP